MNPDLPPPPSPPKPVVKALFCPQCGASISMRSLGQAVAVVCGSCGSVLDATNPQLQVLQAFEKITSRDQPLIPLGTRGKIRGTDYEVIGFERRSIYVEGIHYSWHEYVLFNPYKGFRYLSEYQGHWNDVAVCKEQPIADARFSIALSANYLGEVYRHFQTAVATTDFVLGEFPWEVRVGEKANVTDYVHPPRMLSKEEASGEVTWSVGEYMEGKDIWSTFRLPGQPPEAIGVYENQPSPVGPNIKSVWAVFGLFALVLLLLMIGFDVTSKRETVFQASYQLDPGQPSGEASFVTDTFEVTGRTSTVEVKTVTDVQNNWIYLNYALINQDTGEAWDFGREVSFYSGYDSDGAWKEGGKTNTVTVPSVPAGTYYLRIEPEVDRLHPRIHYSVEVIRGVPVNGYYGIGFLVLLVPPLLISWRAMSFERSRWSESDHPIFTTENS